MTGMTLTLSLAASLFGVEPRNDGGVASGGFAIAWYTIDGGGGASSAGSLLVNGTIGQPDAAEMAGGAFSLRGGFWPGVGVVLPKACTGDFNADGTIDGADLGVLLAEWGACGSCVSDLNDDGTVDGADLGVLLAAWGPCV